MPSVPISAFARRFLPLGLLVVMLTTPLSRVSHTTPIALTTKPGAIAGTGHLSPARGPQLLHRVPANAFPPVQPGFGDQRFGVVEAFDVPRQSDALHVGWERVQIRWDLLQPHGPAQWNVNVTGKDAPFNREIAHGHQLVGVIEGVPAWAAQNPRQGDAAVPKNIALPWNDPRNFWGQFVFRAARHYAGRFDTFVILNEVSIPGGAYRGTVQQYAQLLRVAYLAAHAANPHVEIHMYGDSVYADLGTWFHDTIAALAGFPSARANNYFFDAAELHLYHEVIRWDKIVAIWHGLMQHYGFDRPIWLSETNVFPRDDYVSPALPATHNTLLVNQPSFIVDAFAAALGLGMPRIEVYRMLDPKHIYPEHPAGLVRRDGSVRPEYYAFKTVNTWFAGVTAALYQPGTTALATKFSLFRVTMERPGQEIQVLWNQGGRAGTATVPAVAHTATVVLPNGSTSTIRAAHGRFTLRLAGGTDHDPTATQFIKIGSTPLIVVQTLPQGQHVAGLHPLFVEQDRSAGAGPTLGPVSSVAVAPDGSGTRVLADTAHDRVLIEDAHGHLSTILGGTGGAPGQFRGPAGVAIGPDGTLYVADQGNARIQEFDLYGHLLGGFGCYSGCSAAMQAPTAVAAAPDGTLYVVDAAQDAVLHFSRFGAFLGRWGTPGYGAGQFDGPGGLAVDAAGHVWVADTLNNRVVEFDSAGHVLAQLGNGNPSSGPSSLHWPTAVTVLPGGAVAVADADNARVVVVAHPQTFLGNLPVSVASPGGLAIAPDGTYYVSDTAGNRIVHLDATGRQIGAFGTQGGGHGQFTGPLGLAFGPDGNLYVADGSNNRIDVLTAQGQYVRQFGSQGHAPGQFVGPHAVAVDADGTVWVADTFNARIQHFKADGTPLASITNVNGAWGVAADGHGGVFYSAHWGQRIYHWTPRGQHVWGAPGSGAGEFTHPAALAATANGSIVYIVDEGNARVQFLSGGSIAGQRGSGQPGASGLTDPMAVAIAADGSIAVLDAARHRIVRYVGAGGAAFNATTMPGVPLGLGADGNSAVKVTVCGPWSGTSLQQSLSISATASFTN